MQGSFMKMISISLIVNATRRKGTYIFYRFYLLPENLLVFKYIHIYISQYITCYLIILNKNYNYSKMSVYNIINKNT